MYHAAMHFLLRVLLNAVALLVAVATDPLALVTFFLPVYGVLIPLIPIVLWKGAHRATLGLWLAFLGLFILGLGGTTPLPRWLFAQRRARSRSAP